MNRRRRTALILLVTAILIAASACSGGSKSKKNGSGTTKPRTSAVEEGPFGRGADQVWLFRPRTQTRSVVVFVHGAGDQTEATPKHHRPWLEHLAARGNVVIYPRYELLHRPDALKHLMAGLRSGMSRVKDPSLPVVEIGYSRGGRLAVELAALAPGVGVDPNAILSVFPSPLLPGEPLIDLRAIDPATQIVILVGDQDNVVGDSGERELRARLENAGINHGRIEIVSSQSGFAATHLSVLETTPGARAAYWGRADRLIASVRQSR